MRLHFKGFGQGRPLVILHGLFGSSDNWTGIARRLMDSFRIFAVDLRNHGLSPHAAQMSLPTLAGDLVEFWEAQALESAAVLGHSLGGKVAMQFALRHPDRVEQLVVVDISPRAYPASHEEILRALLALDLASFQTRRQIEDALAPAIPDLAVRRFLLKNLGRNPSGALDWKINLRGIADNYLRLTGAVTGSAPFTKPALFLRGGKSDYIGAADVPLIRQWFPRAEIQTIPEAGHWVQAAAPEEFVRRLRNFL
jgi:esterase